MSRGLSAELKDGSPTADIYVVGHLLYSDLQLTTPAAASLSVREAAELLGRDA